MTTIAYCCYHCANFKTETGKYCAKGKPVCYNALMSINEEKFRAECRRANNECVERFGDTTASQFYSCFERRKHANAR